MVYIFMSTNEPIVKKPCLPVCYTKKYPLSWNNKDFNFEILNVASIASIPIINAKLKTCADKTVQICRLICIFVV